MDYRSSHADGLWARLDVGLGGNGNARAIETAYRTNQPKVFVAGDRRQSQPLVVWAISEGYEVTR